MTQFLLVEYLRNPFIVAFICFLCLRTYRCCSMSEADARKIPEIFFAVMFVVIMLFPWEIHRSVVPQPVPVVGLFVFVSLGVGVAADVLIWLIGVTVGYDLTKHQPVRRHLVLCLCLVASLYLWYKQDDLSSGAFLISCFNGILVFSLATGIETKVDLGIKAPPIEPAKRGKEDVSQLGRGSQTTARSGSSVTSVTRDWIFVRSLVSWVRGIGSYFANDSGNSD